MLDHCFTILAAYLADECQKRGVYGVFAMAEIGFSSVSYSYILCETPLRQDVEGKRNCNFLAVALAKIAMVQVHKKNTGGETSFFGEHPFMGGRISENGKYAYAFSGAPQEIDDELMKLAEELHKQFQS